MPLKTATIAWRRDGQRRTGGNAINSLCSSSVFVQIHESTRAIANGIRLLSSLHEWSFWLEDEKKKKRRVGLSLDLLRKFLWRDGRHVKITPLCSCSIGNIYIYMYLWLYSRLIIIHTARLIPTSVVIRVWRSDYLVFSASGHRLQRGRSCRPIPVFACSSRTFVPFAKVGRRFDFEREEGKTREKRKNVYYIRSTRINCCNIFFPMPYIVSKPLTDITTRWRARVQIKPRQLAYVRSVDGLSDGKEARWDVTPAVSWTPGGMHQISVPKYLVNLFNSSYFI